ncbi:hypothetical protein GCM10009117_22380 [Gangjinia marincola]|uniref:Transporter n=1 Tax=Gangjinia marincola TaxID=578463 RepID=A0ABN1MIR8_9FLAO
MKRFYLGVSLILLLSHTINAQDYIDLVKFSYNNTTFDNGDSNAETEASNTYLEVYVPLPVTSKTVVIGGFTYENTRLGLNFTDDRSNLIMTRLNAGIKRDHGNKWSGTYIVLPKLASDFDDLGSEDFQIGGLALLEKRYSSSYSLKFGSYFSTENFGTTLTPLVGLWYKSDNDKFYINAVLPIRTDIKYSFTEAFGVGANLITSIKSYHLTQTIDDLYVQEESIRFALFAAYGFFDDTLIIRGKAGLDTTDFGVYNQNDTVGLQILTFQVGGDDRIRLNSEFETAPFFGIDLIFRGSL